MNTTLTINSITGKPLGDIFETSNGFGFEHLETGTVVEGFDTFTEARDAFMECHNSWCDTF